MSETELLNGILAMAQVFGWRSAHFRPARTEHGWRTAVSGDGKGFPDVFLVRADRLVIAELKSARGALSVEQRLWLDDLARTKAEVYEWRPNDWTSGAIERVLRHGPDQERRES